MELDSSSSPSSSCSESGEEEEEKKMCLKPPDPCLLCGEPAVHYDCEGNVIKREAEVTPSVLMMGAAAGGEDRSFLSVIYKCFRVPRSGRLKEEGHLVGLMMGGNNNKSLPICVSCEELVLMLLEMYDKVKELENVIKRKVREAEQEKFVEGELYRKYDDDGMMYAALRGALLGGKSNNGVQQVRTSKERRQPCHKVEQLGVVPVKCGGGGGGGGFERKTKKKKKKKPSKSSSRRLVSSSNEPGFNDLSPGEYDESELDWSADAGGNDDAAAGPTTNIICEPSLSLLSPAAAAAQQKEDELLEELAEDDLLLQLGKTIDDDDDDKSAAASPLLETIMMDDGTTSNNSTRLVNDVSRSSGVKRWSPRKRPVTNYAEESSAASSEEDSDSAAEDVKPNVFEDEGVNNNLMKANKRATGTEARRKARKATTTRRPENQRAAQQTRSSRYCQKIKEKLGRRSRDYYNNKIKREKIGRPRKPHRNPFLVKNDKTCRFDPTTGNIFYTYGYVGLKSSSGAAPPPSRKVTLEFVKQPDREFTYTCSSCSRTISFQGSGRGGNKIGSLPLLNHARLHHAKKSAGPCPVCGMPVLSFCHSDYYSHRLSHLSEEERLEALSNPCKKNRGIYPRLPPLETRRKITPESAALHSDVRQCPTCGKFIANGLSALQRHERSHLSDAEKKSHLCAVCGVGFTTKYQLELHILRHHPDGDGGGAQLHKCPICKGPPRLFKTEQSLEAHMRRDVHDGRIKKEEEKSGGGSEPLLPFQCKQCPSSYATGRALKHHVTRTHVNAEVNRGTWTCHIATCSRKFGSKAERLEHYKDVHPKSKIAIDARDPNESFGCEYPSCGKGFPDEAVLQYHVSQEHRAPSASATSAHQFMCPLCGKVVSQDWILKQHHLVHTGERNHVCEVCKASFPIRSTLLSHLAAKHGQGPLSGTFPCEQPGCDKVYQSRVSFKMHMRVVHKIFDGTRRPRRSKN